MPAPVTPAWVHPGCCTGARISLRYEISQRYHVNAKRPHFSVGNRWTGTGSACVMFAILNHTYILLSWSVPSNNEITKWSSHHVNEIQNHKVIAVWNSRRCEFSHVNTPWVELFVPPWLLVIGVSQTSLIIGGFRSKALLELWEEEIGPSAVRCGGDRGAFHLVQIFGNFGSVENGKRFVGSSHWKIPWKSGKSKKVGPLSRLEFSERNFVFNYTFLVLYTSLHCYLFGGHLGVTSITGSAPFWGLRSNGTTFYLSDNPFLFPLKFPVFFLPKWKAPWLSWCLIVCIHASGISIPLSSLTLLGWSLKWIACLPVLLTCSETAEVWVRESRVSLPCSLIRSCIFNI